jgi:hypothetical protein
MGSIRLDVQLPASANQFIREIERIGLKYQFVPMFDLSQLDKSRRVQVRESDHYAPSANVKQYAEAMRGGAEFPPIVVSSDHYVIDANTRIEAAKSIKRPSLPALVITSAYETANNEVKSKYKALAATLNQLGGQRLTTAEARDAALVLLELGWTVSNISRALGLSQQIANKLKKETAARARMSELGIIPPKSEYLAICGSPTLLTLNDEPYRRMVLLIADANLSHREATEVAAQVGKAGSDAAAIDLLKHHRAMLEDRIRSHALTGNGKPSQSALFRRALGSILGYQGREEDAVEPDQSACQAHLAKCLAARDMLEEIVRLQEEVCLDPNGQ